MLHPLEMDTSVTLVTGGGKMILVRRSPNFHFHLGTGVSKNWCILYNNTPLEKSMDNEYSRKLRRLLYPANNFPGLQHI